MIKITKDEAKYLYNNGVNFGDAGLAHTHGKYKHYYMCEIAQNFKLLKEYRESRRMR